MVETFEAIRNDLYRVLSRSAEEVPGLLNALRDGDINGSAYYGECACLLGTLARLRGCDHDQIPGLVPDPHRPAETWFRNIRPGDTPTNNIHAALTAAWIETWLAWRRI